MGIKNFYQKRFLKSHDGVVAEKSHNNKFIESVYLINRTRVFRWLVVGDPDTCYKFSRDLSSFLFPLRPKYKHSTLRSKSQDSNHRFRDKFRFLDHTSPFFLGSRCDHPRFRIPMNKVESKSEGTLGLWPYGGKGYMISRGLLDRVPATGSTVLEAFRDCNTGGGQDTIVACWIRRVAQRENIQGELNAPFSLNAHTLPFAIAQFNKSTSDYIVVCPSTYPITAHTMSNWDACDIRVWD